MRCSRRSCPSASQRASAHLKALRNARRLTSRRYGKSIHYRLTGPDVAGLGVKLREVAIRISPKGSGSRVDMRSRSRSRIGQMDRGVNARRIRDLLSALKTRAQSV